MKLHRRKFVRLAAAAAALPVMSHFAWAQTYPSRPVRVIVPFAPGGQTDVVARLVAQKLSEQLGNQFFVENVGGAGGNIGAGRAAQAAPDGYTIIFVDGIAFTANPSLYSKISYDPVRNFDPIASRGHDDAGAGGAPIGASENDPGACCRDQGQPRQVQLRVRGRRNRSTSHWRVVPQLARP